MASIIPMKITNPFASLVFCTLIVVGQLSTLSLAAQAQPLQVDKVCRAEHSENTTNTTLSCKTTCPQPVTTEVRGFVTYAGNNPQLTMLTPPYLQNMETDRMVVMAEFEEQTQLAVEYGLTAELGMSVLMTSVASGRPATSKFSTESYFYRGTMTDLQPGTEYFYRIVTAGGTAAEGVTAASTFRTAPASAEDFTFVAIGDMQTDNRIRTSKVWAWEADPWEPTKKMLDHMVQRNPRFMLGLGDHADDGNRYDRTRFSHLDRVAKIFGPHAPFFISWGNHDGNSPNHPLRLSADMPSRWRTDSFSTTKPTPGFGSFTFEYAGVYFVCLEYFACFKGGYIQDAAANDITNGWLDAALATPAAQDAKFRIVAVHVPPFCERWIDGNAGLREHLVPRLEKYQVDLCLSGHMHGYERGHINGVQYVISGGGSYLDIGEPLVANWNSKADKNGWLGGHIAIPGDYAMQSAKGVLGAARPIEGGLFHGYSEITVRGSKLRLDQHAFNADGSYIGILDSIELDKSETR